MVKTLGFDGQIWHIAHIREQQLSNVAIRILCMYPACSFPFDGNRNAGYMPTIIGLVVNEVLNDGREMATSATVHHP